MSSPSRSGAFNVEVDKAVEHFTESVSFDQRLFLADIEGSTAHAKMLGKQGVISDDDAEQIVDALAAIAEEFHQGTFELDTACEDVHMNIEQALINKIGDVGRKLHTGRSRNDQISTDQRIWIRWQMETLDQLLAELQLAMIEFAERERSTIIPAYTHLQRAQPVLAPHYFIAFCEKFQRDRERIADCRKRVNQCSLGTAALAGTSMNVDRNWVAKELGFDGLVRNSLDSSSDRDYVIEFVFCLTMISLHLSTLAEEWIIWKTIEFDFIDLPQQYCTGSSIMPQKINPDVLELIRGKTARTVGSLQTLLTLVKGLPMAYNRDLQEDKPALFDAVETVIPCLQMAIGIAQGAKLKRESISRNIEKGYLDATTLMEFLIKRGMPQRKAHHLIGAVVRSAMEQGKELAELTLDEFQTFEASLDQSVYDVLGVQNAVKAFVSQGSTAPEEVDAEIAHWKSALGLV